jgi:hypothetical protein
MVLFNIVLSVCLCICNYLRLFIMSMSESVTMSDNSLKYMTLLNLSTHQEAFGSVRGMHASVFSGFTFTSGEYFSNSLPNVDKVLAPNKGILNKFKASVYTFLQFAQLQTM